MLSKGAEGPVLRKGGGPIVYVLMRSSTVSKIMTIAKDATMPVNNATAGICRMSIAGSFIKKTFMTRINRSCFDLSQMADDRAHGQVSVNMRE